jgi:cytoplasmic iron level regulating protein YaaA (DUF328/UPF0246 family)
VPHPRPRPGAPPSPPRYPRAVLVLLPPSETKATGGRGVPLDLAALGHPELTSVRRTLLDALVALSADVDRSVVALGLGPKQSHEVARNAHLLSSPTMPALLRYTGVLYDALDVRTLTPRARARLSVASALFGLLRATDPVPAYRLSAGSALPGLGGLRTLWRPVLTPALAAVDELVVDLRSGAYAALGPAPGAVTATVLTERADGSRTVVSHLNKSHKGRLARALVSSRAEPSDAAGVARVAARAGLRVELTGEHGLVVLTDEAGHAL